MVSEGSDGKRGDIQLAYCPSGSGTPSATRRDCPAGSTDQRGALSGSRYESVRTTHSACDSVYVLFLVPECEGDILQAMRVAYPSNAVFAPAEGARTCHVVREVCHMVSEGH
jgi:hypothetical protein